MQITYKDKVTLQSNPNIPDENKVTAKDMNEIKSVVNSNEEEQQALNMSVQEIAQNVVNNSQEISNIKEEQTTQNDNIQTNRNNISDLQSNKADKSEIPTDLSQLSNKNTKFVNETGLENAISQEKTQRQNADNNLQNQIDAITASTDVIDIVGTYQDLQDYDTSKVKQNDVIKVLQDSTHNNAMSYYRWQNQWIYIGSEGPYYTIGQTDELLQGKANQSDLNQTNTNVTILAGRVSNNESKIENIEQEQTEQNTNITNNATNIESLQKDNENLKKIVSQLPQVEGQGTSITLENTIEAPFTIFDVEGNSVQDGSPSPDNEVPIKSAGDNGSINEKISNGNNFDGIMEQGDIPSYNGQNQNNTLCIRSKNYIPLEPSTAYFFERFGLLTDSVGLRFYDKDKNYLSSETTSMGYNVKTKAFTSGNNVYYMRFTDWTNNLSNTYMLSKGNKSVPYVPHEEQDYSIFVQQPMRNIGDVRDLFFKNTVDSPYYDENLTLNGWYERHYIGEVILNGSENWNYEGGRFVLNFLISALDISGRQKVYSNYFEYLPSGSADYGIFVYKASSTNSQIYIYDKDYTTVEEFKTWLSTHNVVVQYELAEPLDLPCTETQIQQIENKPSTYKDFTIIQSEDETPAYLEVSGIRDIDTMFDKVTNAIVSLGGNV